VAWFTNADDTPRVQLARSPQADYAFSAPLEVSTGVAIGRVGLELLDDGSAVVSWLQNNNDGLADLIVTHVSADGVVGKGHTVASNVAALSVPQLSRDGDYLLLVWTSGSDSMRQISSARVNLKSLI
jgi:hypothetical protein